MSDQLRDIWQDLREKRLWPIALVLVLAIVAVPVLLTKSSAQPPTASAPLAAPSAPEKRITVEMDDADAASSGTGSSLDQFAEGDPFTPPAAIARAGRKVSGTEAAAAGPTTAGDGGAGGGAPSPQAPPSSPDRPIDVAPPTTRTETAEYEYVADVTFWNGARRRRMRGVRKLDMLPNESAPLLIFMGTSANGGNAVFLVDSTLEAAGEGRCVPSGANCAYVHIGPGSEHAFSTEVGDSYRVRVDQIRRVKVSASGRGSRSRARASVGHLPARRRFQIPALTDLVAVRTTETTPSSTGSSTAGGGR